MKKYWCLETATLLLTISIISYYVFTSSDCSGETYLLQRNVEVLTESEDPSSGNCESVEGGCLVNDGGGGTIVEGMRSI